MTDTYNEVNYLKLIFPIHIWNEMLQTCLLIFTIPNDGAICQSATAAATATEAWSNIPLLNLHRPKYI